MDFFFAIYAILQKQYQHKFFRTAHDTEHGRNMELL